ncbi:MAG: 1-acyl-sn-glycerol-3-phosphate acyltransferase [Candidatus Poribacteria bacterium]|nr:1-acyl-sn-glycerol-3-phosphate acyltransferase [Candidatus Poribacteria bacterium]MDE0316055.1 1-acyl-sn-glycerol-3-phosphate acyltransferase [Candidatus Poribacteria bacterium]
MLDFKPPKPNITVIKVAQALVPLANRLFLKGLTIDIDAESITQLKSIHGNPTVIVPNHAASEDPAVVFLLSKRLSQPFYYMAACEIFDKGKLGGIRSFVMQRLGVYSVVRGTVDRNAFRMTRQLLCEGKWPLVIFGEGEISHQNDTVMRFERGVTQLCFWALDDIKKGDIDKPLYAVPIGIKYRYTEDMWNSIDTALTELERNILPLASRTPAERYQRLRRIGIAVLKTLADEYQFKVEATASLNEQIQGLKEQILSHAEKIMGIYSDNDVLTRVRALRNIVDAEVYRDVDEMTEYERKIHEEQLQKFQQFYPDLNRLVNFIAISDGYVAEEHSPERYLEVIFRLEKEVFGTAKMRGPRVASIRAGEPKNLMEYYDTYKSQKKETVEQITNKLETEVQNLVTGLS